MVPKFLTKDVSCLGMKRVRWRAACSKSVKRAMPTTKCAAYQAIQKQPPLSLQILESGKQDGHNGPF